MFKKSESKNFEIVTQVRDKDGNPTGQVRSHSSNYGSDINKFWIRNSFQAKKTKRGKGEAAKTEKEIQQGLKAAQEYTDNKRKKKGLDD